MKKFFLTLALLAGLVSTAQVKIGDNATNVNDSSLLELESTTKGLLFPRVALTGTANVAPLAAHVAGMTVYNTATTGDVTPGMYTNNGTAWVKLGDSTGALYGKPVRSTTSAITWAANDVFIHLANGYNGGDISLPSASSFPGRIVGINNRSGGPLNIALTDGSATGIYANENISALNPTVGMVTFISDGTSWRLYAGRP